MKRAGLYLFVILLSACSGPKLVKKEKAESANMGSYKTFDFYTVEASGDTIPQLFSDRISKLENAITLELQKHGYLLSKTNPDLYVNIGIVVNEKVQTRETDFATDAPRYLGQRHYSWKSQEVEVGRYRQGTVSVDLVDRKQNALVWQGVIEGVLPKNESKMDETIRKGVKKLFKGFSAAK